MPVVSVVMPTYNRREWVKIMIDSVLVQTYQDWELIVVDDGSSDGTVELLEEYSKQDHRIKFIKRESLPKGAQTCRNIGFNESIGTYVIFFDSDDYLPSHTLFQRVKYMEEHKELDFAVFPFASFYEDPHICNGILRGAVKMKGNDLNMFMYSSLPFVVWNNIYKREALVKNKILWDDQILSLQDADFNMQTLRSNMKYAYAESAQVDYHFRIGNSSHQHISQKIKSEAHFNSHLYFLNKELESLSKEWINKHKHVVRWCFAHKFLLSVECNNENYKKSLLNIARKYEVYKLIKRDISLFQFANNKLKMSIRWAKYLTYPAYMCSLILKERKRYYLVTKYHM